MLYCKRHIEEMCYYIYNMVSYSNFLDAGPSLVDSPARVEMGMERFIGSRGYQQKEAVSVDSSVLQSLTRTLTTYLLHNSVHHNCLVEFEK